jgi:hypothetical protein
VIPAARVADGGDVIDIHAKTKVMGVGQGHSFRLPGFVTSTAASAGGMSLSS